jgi:CubicO group peptidase (beta-lactamase class C family)
VLVSSATKKNLTDYLSEEIWRTFGMEQDASWILGSTGHEISGCCVQASTRDFARFGQFMLGGGMAEGKPVLPDGWIAAATTKQADTDEARIGLWLSMVDHG